MAATSGELLIVTGFVAILAVIAVAGFIFDWLHPASQPQSMRNGAKRRHAVVMFRYYHDVGDSRVAIRTYSSAALCAVAPR